jgi:hypothetical protein
MGRGKEVQGEFQRWEKLTERKKVTLIKLGHQESSPSSPVLTPTRRIVWFLRVNLMRIKLIFGYVREDEVSTVGRNGGSPKFLGSFLVPRHVFILGFALRLK